MHHQGGAEVEDLFMCTFFQQKTGAPAGRVAVKNCTLSNISGHTKTWVFGLTPAAGSTFKANKQYDIIVLCVKLHENLITLIQI